MFSRNVQILNFHKDLVLLGYNHSTLQKKGTLLFTCSIRADIVFPRVQKWRQFKILVEVLKKRNYSDNSATCRFLAIMRLPIFGFKKIERGFN